MEANEYKDDGSLRIPLVKCTHETFFKYLPHLRIRDLLCWALRTETTIRLAKVEGRMNQSTNNNNDDNNDNNEEEEDYSYNKTLNSNII